MGIVEMKHDDKVKTIKEIIEIANRLLDDKGKISFAEFLEDQGVEVRVCSQCGKLMNEGYCIGDGEEHYCSDECLEKNMTREEYNKLYDNGNGKSYYWEFD